MNTQALIDQLLIAFPRTKLSPPQLSLYRTKLETLTNEQRDRAFESAVDKHRYKTIPSIAELLAWGQGKEPGKGKSKRDKRSKWDADTIAFLAREEAAEKRGDAREVDFLRRVRRAWNAARWRKQHSSLHPQDYGFDLETELDQLGMNFDGSTQNGRPHHELATVGVT